MGEAYRTWIILYCTKALFACVALHVFSSIKMSKRKQATLGEFCFSKKVCHRDGEVDVIIPNSVEDKDVVKRIQCLHCSDKFVNQQGLSIHIKCKHPR